MKQKLSRYEINQKIKGIGASPGADLGRFTYSFSDKAAGFPRQFLKITGQDMKHQGMAALGIVITAGETVEKVREDAL